MNNIPHNQQGRYIITCNFDEFRIYDLDKVLPESHPTIIKLDELTDKSEVFTRLFSYDKYEQDIIIEEKVSAKAGRLVGQLYDKLKNLYPKSELLNFRTSKSIEKSFVIR